MSIRYDHPRSAWTSKATRSHRFTTRVLGAYPRGWRVIHDGDTYEATAPGVTTAPPGDGWTEIDPDTALVDFWEDREYSEGEQVRDAGRIWTATSTVQGARPSDYPGGWTPTA